MTSSDIDAMRAEAEEGTEVTIERNRFGYTIAGQYYRRVTTFCGGIPKDWLGAWAAKEVAEYAVEHRDKWAELPKTDAVKLLKGAPWSKRDDAGDRGTAVHNTIEAITRGLALPDNLKTEDELDCAIAAESFLRQRSSRILATELTVFSPGLGYAGTLDQWEIDANGVSWILDWKTSSGIYAEHAIQLAAYRNAQFAVVNKVQIAGKGGTERWKGRMVEWGPHKAERLGVVHVRPDGATLHPVEYSDRLWTVFRAAAHVKLWQLDTDSYGGKKPREAVFGEPAFEVTTKGAEDDKAAEPAEAVA